MELNLYYVTDQNLEDVSTYWCKLHKLTHLAEFLNLVETIPHNYKQLTFPCLIVNNSAVYCNADINDYLDKLPMDIKAKIIKQQRTG